MVENAVQTNPELTTYNVVFSIDADKYFTPEYVSELLEGYGVSGVSPRKIDRQLRHWADSGKLTRMGRAYSVVRA